VASPFDVLGVDPDADEGEIVEAYRKRVKEAHPDRGGSAEAFRRVQAAYERIRAGRGDEAIESRDERGTGAATSPGADGSNESGGDGSGDGEDGDREREVRVEYLDYGVLADRGWSLDDDDLFEKAAAAGLHGEDYGELLVDPDDSLLEAAEKAGFAWPYACRGGACANCAVAMVEGDLSLPVDHILPREMVERGIRLSCVGAPLGAATKVVFNVKHLPDLDELRLPPRPFEQANAGD
jgi:curved DNA-binding protein CbpA